jgi:hypothetical protein
MTEAHRYVGRVCRVSGQRLRYFARDGELCPNCAARNFRAMKGWKKGTSDINPWDWNAPTHVALDSEVSSKHDCIDTCT